MPDETITPVRRPIPVAKHPWDAGRMTPETREAHERYMARVELRRAAAQARRDNLHKPKRADSK